MGIWNTGLKSAKLALNHVRPDSLLSPVRKLARQRAIQATHGVRDGVHTGVVEAAAELADPASGAVTKAAKAVKDKTEKAVEAATDKAIDKEMAKLEKSWVGRHPYLTGAAGLGAAEVGYNMLKDDGSIPPADVAYNQGSRQAENDAMEAMMAANVNAAPTMMAGDFEHQGMVEGQQRTASL